MSLQAFEDFNSNYPRKMLKLPQGELIFRYAKHPTSKVTLILLAGGMGIGDGCFIPLITLADHFSIISLNYSPDFPTNAEQAQAISLLIRKLDLKNVYLVGQSYGGLIAQVIAKHYPDLIKGMILSNTGTLTSDMDFSGFENLYQIMKKSDRFKKLDSRVPLPLLKPIIKASIKKKGKNTTPELQTKLNYFADIVLNQCTNEHLLLMDTLLVDLKNEWNFTKADFTSYDNEILLLLSEDDTTFVESVKSALIRLMPNPIINTSILGGHLAMLYETNAYTNAIIGFINTRNQV